MYKLSYEYLFELVKQKNDLELNRQLEKTHPADIAEIINDLPSDFAFYVFAKLTDEMASDVIAELNDEAKETILDRVKEARLIRIIDEMETDEAADILSDLKDEISSKVLENIDKVDSDSIKDLLTYDEESAGGLMKTEIISVNRKMKRDELIDDIRGKYSDIENIHYIFVIDDDEKLIGVLEVVRLLLAQENKIAEDLMEKEVLFAPVTMDQEKVARIFRKYDLFVLPVVDEKGKLLGRITVDDIIDVIDDEASEDAYKMVGLENEDKVFTSPLNSVKKRLPWLTLNLFTALIVSSVVGIFEQTIAKLSILAVLMPIVAGLGGNSGTQTLTVITRGIALGELTIHNTYKAIFKEVLVGIINGVLIGTFAIILAYLLKGQILLGVVLGVAMVANMFIAGFFGAVVPVIMKSLKLDPALASSVIITMLTDIGGFASFLGLATILL